MCLFFQRFFISLRDGGHVHAIPLECKQWISPANELATMYTPEMFLLSKWEIENCPWWIDLIKGQLLEREKEKYKEIFHELPKEVLQPSPEMRGSFLKAFVVSRFEFKFC